MSILSFILALLVIGAVIYGIKLALAGNWQQLIYLLVGLIAAIWILSLLGISLPNIPRLG